MEPRGLIDARAHLDRHLHRIPPRRFREAGKFPRQFREVRDCILNDPNNVNKTVKLFKMNWVHDYTINKHCIP